MTFEPSLGLKKVRAGKLGQRRAIFLHTLGSQQHCCNFHFFAHFIAQARKTLFQSTQQAFKQFGFHRDSFQSVFALQTVAEAGSVSSAPGGGLAA